MANAPQDNNKRKTPQMPVGRPGPSSHNSPQRSLTKHAAAAPVETVPTIAQTAMSPISNPVAQLQVPQTAIAASQFEATELELPGQPQANQSIGTNSASAREKSSNSMVDFETHKQAMQHGVFRQMHTANNALGLLSRGELIEDWGGEVTALISNSSTEAEVYLARKGNTNYALKYYRVGISPKQEVLDALIQMAHPALIKTFKLGVHKGSYYEVLQFAAGGPLNKKEQDKFAYLPVDEKKLEDIVRVLNEGLHYLHSQGLIHRDIKPGNILVGDFKKNEFMFADFGISSLLDLDSGATERMTTINRTEGYAAPEVYSGITRREVDYYALGITFYSILTGKNPFQNMNSRHIMCFTVQGRVAEELLAREEAKAFSERTKRLIAGLLVVKNEERWGYTAIQKWLNGEDVTFYQGKNDNIIEFQYDGGIITDLSELAKLCVSHANDPAWQRFVKLHELSAWARKFDNVLAAQIKEIEVHYGGLGKPHLALRNIAYVLDPEIPFESSQGAKATNRRELYEILQSERKHYLGLVRDVNADLYLWLSSRLKDQSLIGWCRDYLSETKDENEAFEGICQAILGFDSLYITSDLILGSLRELKNHVLTERQRSIILELLNSEKSRLYVWARLTHSSSLDADILFFWKTYVKESDIELFLKFVNSFAIIHFEGWQYKGQIEFKNDKQMPHGVGLGVHTDGRKYIGSWAGGLRHGKGTTEYPTGEKFNGIYEKDREEGEGVFSYTDGRSYSGKFVLGKLQGIGQLKDKTGVYQGHFRDGLRHGVGTCKYKRGDVYQGEWEDDLRHGRGTMNFSTGEIYSGSWKRGAMEGQGQLSHPKRGWTYTGGFLDSKREGLGVLENLGGSWEQGIWKKNSLFHGQRVKREQYQLRYVHETVNAGKTIFKLNISGEKKSQVALRCLLPGMAYVLGTYFTAIAASLFIEDLTIQAYIALIMLILAFLLLPGCTHLASCAKALMGLAVDKNGDRILDWSAHKTLSKRR